jgi:hypothetical protein
MTWQRTHDSAGNQSPTNGAASNASVHFPVMRPVMASVVASVMAAAMAAAAASLGLINRAESGFRASRQLD